MGKWWDWPVVLGFDLREIHPRHMRTSAMWGRHAFLRRSRFICYQGALIIPVVSESVGTWVFAKYLDLQSDIHDADPSLFVHINNIVGAGAYAICAAVAVAIVFGANFFFLLFYYEHDWPQWTRNGWKYAGVLVTAMWLGSCLTTTIIVAKGYARVSGPITPEAISDVINAIENHVDLRYREFSGAIAFTVLSWVGLVFVVASCVLLWISDDHDKGHAHYNTNGQPVDSEMQATSNGGAMQTSVPAQTAAEAGSAPSSPKSGKKTKTANSVQRW